MPPRQRREIHVLLGAIKVAERLGMWVIHSLAETDNLDHLIGYMRHRVEDFERRRARTTSQDRRVFYASRIGHWKRALRWMSQIGPDDANQIGKRILAAMAAHKEWSKLPYVSRDEVDPRPAKPDQKLRDKPPRRRATRRWPKPRRHGSQVCDRCDGIGWVVR